MLSIRGDTQFKGDLKRLLQRGDVWNYFTHDPSRSRAFHWGDRAAQGPYLDLPAWAYHVFELSIAA